MNKCGVTFFSGGDLGSHFYLHLPGSKLWRSFPSWHRAPRVRLSRAANALANFCNAPAVNAVIPEATCILSFCISVPKDARPYQMERTACNSLVRVTLPHPQPHPALPRESCWAPCPGKVLARPYFCRPETPRFERVNSLSTITLHITQA